MITGLLLGLLGAGLILSMPLIPLAIFKFKETGSHTSHTSQASTKKNNVRYF